MIWVCPASDLPLGTGRVLRAGEPVLLAEGFALPLIGQGRLTACDPPAVADGGARPETAPEPEAPEPEAPEPEPPLAIGAGPASDTPPAADERSA